MLQAQINDLIYCHPSLFLAKNYADSRLRALNQMFFVLGNGYDWKSDKDGKLFLAYYKGQQEQTSLPDWLFKEKMIFSMSFEPGKIEEVKAELGKRRHYFLKRNSDEFNSVIFATKTKKAAASIYAKFQDEQSRMPDGAVFVYQVNNGPPNYYELCNLSPINEMIANGKPSDYRQDVIDGALEAVHHAHAYYSDPNIYQREISKKLFSKPTQKQWEQLAKSQLKYLNKFLAKFEKPVLPPAGPWVIEMKNGEKWEEVLGTRTATEQEAKDWMKIVRVENNPNWRCRQKVVA